MIQVMIEREMSDAMLDLQVKRLERKVANGEKVIAFVQAEWNVDIKRLNETVYKQALEIEEQALEIRRLKAANERLEKTLSTASNRIATALSDTNK